VDIFDIFSVVFGGAFAVVESPFFAGITVKLAKPNLTSVGGGYDFEASAVINAMLGCGVCDRGISYFFIGALFVICVHGSNFVGLFIILEENKRGEHYSNKGKCTKGNKIFIHVIIVSGDVIVAFLGV